MTWSY